MIWMIIHCFPNEREPEKSISLNIYTQSTFMIPQHPSIRKSSNNFHLTCFIPTEQSRVWKRKVNNRLCDNIWTFRKFVPQGVLRQLTVIFISHTLQRNYTSTWSTLRCCIQSRGFCLVCSAWSGISESNHISSKDLKWDSFIVLATISSAFWITVKWTWTGIGKEGNWKTTCTHSSL